MTIPAHVPIDLGIEKAAKLLKSDLTSSDRVFGWHRKSVGVRVRKEGNLYWLRIQRQLLDSSERKAWCGAEEAAKIRRINKPEFIDSVEWDQQGWRWKAELMTYVAARSCSPTPELTHQLALSDRWWTELRHSLLTLSTVPTTRINTRHEYFVRRIGDRFGYGINTAVENWTTAHGDIHWANLTSPELSILDWEAWGKAPSGLDAAFLKCFSLLRPEIASQVELMFGDWLTTRDGKLCQLFAIAELLYMTENHGDHSKLLHPLQKLGSTVQQDLLH